MRATEKRKTILVVSDEEHDLSQIKRILEKKYRVFYVEKGKHQFERDKERSGNISAAITCVKDAAADGYALFSWLESDTLLMKIPQLVYYESPDERLLAEGCIARGAVDVICPPICERLILNRVQNAIRLRESATYEEMERWLEVLPSNIYLKDEQGRYIFVTHYWEHLENAGDPDWTIRGKTDVEVRVDKENARRAMESDDRILKSGKGDRYIIEEKNSDGSEFLELIKEPVIDETGQARGIVALINNVTELVALRRKVEESSQRDELTGVRNKKGYVCEMERIAQLIENQRAEFGLVVIDMNGLKKINDTYGHEKGDVAIRRLSHLICIIFSHSHVFRIGGDEFVVLIKKEDCYSYKFMEESFREQMRSYRGDSSLAKWEQISAAIGAAFYDPDRDSSYKDVFERADHEMYICKRAMYAGRK